MAEGQGPVYEGKADFRQKLKAFGEKVKQKGSEVKMGLTARKVKDRIAENIKQRTGAYVEEKWMRAYQRTVDAFTPGLRKKVAERVRPLAVVAAKSARVGAAVVDLAAMGIGALGFGGGLADVVAPGKWKLSTGSRTEGLKMVAGGGILGILGAERITQKASGWYADIGGAAGEKVAQITNKILHGKPKAPAAA